METYIVVLLLVDACFIGATVYIIRKVWKEGDIL